MKWLPPEYKLQSGWGIDDLRDVSIRWVLAIGGLAILIDAIHGIITNG